MEKGWGEGEGKGNPLPSLPPTKLKSTTEFYGKRMGERRGEGEPPPLPPPDKTKEHEGVL